LELATTMNSISDTRSAALSSAESCTDNYAGLGFSQAELVHVMRSYYDDLIDVVAQDSFQRFYYEMMALSRVERPNFVATELFDPRGRERRGIHVPDDVLLQTSAFGDRRPTLFAIKKMLPEKFAVAWENVNLTFDNEYEDSTVPRDTEGAWRAPLPVALQNSMLSRGEDLQSLPTSAGVRFGIYTDKVSPAG
jgi:hypothetical protein